MATTNFTPLLGLALPTTGDLQGTWGTEVNNAITSLLDSAVAGTTSLSVDADTTLTTTNGSANQARSAVLSCTGTRTTTRYITAPAQSKAYIVINSTTGGFPVVIRGAGPTVGVSVPAGTKTLVAWDGVDFSAISSSSVNVSSVTGTLPVANGGTGQTSFTANYVPYGNGTSPLSTSANFQFDGTVMRVGSNAPLGALTNPVIASTGGTNGYIQSYIYNATNGASSSADFVAYANNSTDAHGWADLGFTSASYADAAYTVTGPNEAYVFGSALNSTYTGNLVYATDSTGSANSHQWYVGGFAQAKNAWKMQLTSSQLQLTNTLAPLGTTSTISTILLNAAETATVSATAATGTINFDVTTQSVLYYTANASANWTVNFRASSGTTLDAAMSVGQSVTTAFLVTQGSTAYYNSAVQINSTTTGVTTKWQGGTAPTAGNASGIDCYTYTIIKTGSATFTVLAALTQYK